MYVYTPSTAPCKLLYHTYHWGVCSFPVQPNPAIYQYSEVRYIDGHVIHSERKEERKKIDGKEIEVKLLYLYLPTYHDDF